MKLPNIELWNTLEWSWPIWSHPISASFPMHFTMLQCATLGVRLFHYLCGKVGKFSICLRWILFPTTLSLSISTNQCLGLEAFLAVKSWLNKAPSMYSETVVAATSKENDWGSCEVFGYYWAHLQARVQIFEEVAQHSKAEIWLQSFCGYSNSKCGIGSKPAMRDKINFKISYCSLLKFSSYALLNIRW